LTTLADTQSQPAWSVSSSSAAASVGHAVVRTSGSELRYDRPPGSVAPLTASAYDETSERPDWSVRIVCERRRVRQHAFDMAKDL